MAARSIANHSGSQPKWSRSYISFNLSILKHLPEEILLTEAFHHDFPIWFQWRVSIQHFHHNLPRVAQLLPIPRRYESLGVRRYGFHGLSYAFFNGELRRVAGPQAANGRVILAHLGNGGEPGRGL